MAKIPIILESGRADGKLATSDAIFDENKGMFQSELNDIQDTLNSDNSNKPLSAKQGKVLKELLDSKVIEAGSVPIDTEPTEGNITHVVNSDGLAKEFNKCNTTIINTDRIANEAIIPSKLSVDIQNLITNLNKTATFAGIATPITDPGTPDGPVFYIATTAGSYSNFSNIEVLKGETAILKWNNGTWEKNAFVPMTDFYSVFNADGNSLTQELNILDLNISELGKEVNNIIGFEDSYIDFSKFTEHPYFPNDGGKWGGSTNKHIAVSVSSIKGGKIAITANAINNSFIAFIKSYNPVLETHVDYATGYTRYVVIEASETKEYIVPDDCEYVILQTKRGVNDNIPSAFCVKGTEGELSDINNKIIDVKVSIDTLNNKVETSIDTLNNKVEDIKEYITEVENEVNNVVGLKDFNIDISAYEQYTYFPNDGGKWGGSTNKHIAIDVSQLQGRIISITANDSFNAFISFVKNYTPNPVESSPVYYATGYNRYVNVPAKETKEYEIPNDCTHVIIQVKRGDNYNNPTLVSIKGTEGEIDKVKSRINALEEDVNIINDNMAVVTEIKEQMFGKYNFFVEKRPVDGIVPINKVIGYGVYSVDVSWEDGPCAIELRANITNTSVKVYRLVVNDVETKEINFTGISNIESLYFYIPSVNKATNIHIALTAKASLISSNNEVDALCLPNYLFKIDNGDIERKPVTLYLEGIERKDDGVTLNGGTKVVICNRTSSSKSISTYPVDIDCKNINQRLKIPVHIINPSKVSNAKAKVLIIGDSMSEGGAPNPISGKTEKFATWWHYIAYASKFNSIVNGKNPIITLGASTVKSAKFTYEGQEYETKSNAEAFGGWSCADYLYHPCRMGGGSTLSGYFGGKETWHLLGLYSKTYFDVSGYNTSTEDFVEGDIEQKKVLYTTPFGRYKIDHCEEIWDKIKFIDTNFHVGENWNGSSEQKSAVEDWMMTMCNNTTTESSRLMHFNKFFDINKARAYTGDHNWTYDNAFSIDTYLSRYRNLDNNGEPLSGDDGASVVGTDGMTYTKGTLVSHVNNLDVCTPTHIIVELATNDGYDYDICISNLQVILRECKAFGAIVGWLTPRFGNGVFRQDMWQGCPAYKKEFLEHDFNVVKKMQELYATNLGNNDEIQFIPAYFVQTPASGINDTWCHDENGNRVVLGINDDDHPGIYGYHDVGIQTYGWLLNTMI